MINIINFLKTTPYYLIKPVKDIKCSCCPNCEIMALDFDTVKDQFFEYLKIDDYKLCSVDGILFDKHRRAFCIFDMKRYNPLSGLTEIEYVGKELKKMSNKIVDSIYILSAIMGYYGLDKEHYPILLHPKKLKIFPYMVVNLKSSQEILNVSLALQKELRISLSKRIEENIMLINCEQFEYAFSKAAKL
jgi:hypothetical protein